MKMWRLIQTRLNGINLQKKVVLVIALTTSAFAMADNPLGRPTLEKLAARSVLTARVSILSSEVVGEFGNDECGIVHTGLVRSDTRYLDTPKKIVFFSYQGYRAGEDYYLFLSDKLPFSDAMIAKFDDKEIIPAIRVCQETLTEHGVAFATTSMKVRLRIVMSSIDSSQEWIEVDPTTVDVSKSKYVVRTEKISDCTEDESNCDLLRQRQLVSLSSVTEMMGKK